MPRANPQNTSMSKDVWSLTFDLKINIWYLLFMEYFTCTKLSACPWHCSWDTDCTTLNLYRPCSEFDFCQKHDRGPKNNIDIPNFTVGQQMHACNFYRPESLHFTIVLFDARLALLSVFFHSMYFYFDEWVNYLPLLRIIGLRKLVTADNLQETQKIMPARL